MVPFVAPEQLEIELGHTFLLRLGANESPFGASTFGVKGAKASLDSLQNYADPRGVELRTAIGVKLDVSVDQIVLGSGIDELLGLFCRLFLDPGDRVVTTLGSYPTFAFAALGAGAEIVSVPYQDDRPDLDSLAVSAKDAKLVYLANPDNPSGFYHDPDQLEAFLTRIPSKCVVLLDEAYVDFLDPREMLSTTLVKNVVRLRTFSKIFGLAGLRLGYATADPDHITALEKIRLHFGINSVAQSAGIMAMQHFGHAILVRERNRKCREVLCKMGEKRGLRPLPSSTNFVTFDCGSKERADAELSTLLRNRVFVRKPSQPPLDRCIRITIGTEEQLSLLDQLWPIQQ